MNFSDALNHEIASIERRKKAWGIFALIAVANGFTSGLMGFPDINAIASLDGLPMNHFWFSLSERIFMMIASGLMMLPFFQQLFKSTVYQGYHKRTDEDYRAIRQDSTLGHALAESKKQGWLWRCDWLFIISIATLIGYTVGTYMRYNALNIPLIALISIGIIVIYRAATYWIRRHIKQQVNNQTQITITAEQRKAIINFPRRKRTEKIIRQAIQPLLLIQFAKPTEQQLQNALIKSIYLTQVERYRTLISRRRHTESSSLACLREYRTNNDQGYVDILDRLLPIDKQVDESPLIRLERTITDKKYDRADIYQTLQDFRQWAIEKHTLVSTIESHEEYTTFSSLSTNQQEAILAEIAEEKGIDDKALSDAVRLQAMTNRMQARSDAEITRLQQTTSVKQPWWKFSYLGNALGMINAWVNAAINGAVSGKIILLILPIIFGLSITNPIILFSIIGATCIAGFTSSYIITRASIIGVFSKIDNQHMRARLIARPLHTKPSSWGLTLLVAIAASGLAVLSGMQVYYILMIYMPSFALASSLFVAAISFIAVFSLFLDYACATLDKRRKNQDFIHEHFPQEAHNAQAISPIYRYEMMTGAAVGITTAFLLWQIFPQHIVLVSLLGLTSFCASWMLIGTLSNSLYKKRGINHLNMIAKSGFSITLLYCICLMVAVTLGICSIPLLSGHIVGTLIALSVSTIVAGLYFPYVWNTATSPDINIKATVIDSTPSSDTSPPFATSHPMIIALAVSLPLLASIWCCATIILPNLYYISIAMVIGLALSYYCAKDIVNSLQVYQRATPMLPEKLPGGMRDKHQIKAPSPTSVADMHRPYQSYTGTGYPESVHHS